MLFKTLLINWIFLTSIVTSGYDDLSANKITQQYKTSLVCQSCIANTAVDRDIKTCTKMTEIGLSSPDESTWWYVDLGDTYNVFNIRIQFKDYGQMYTMRQRGRFAGFLLYVSNTTNRHSGYLCYKNGPELPPLDFNTNCITHGRYIIFYNERLFEKNYPMGYETSNVYTELCEVTVTGCTSGVYGENCDRVCPSNCQEQRCDIINGTCLGCTPGWEGARCDKACLAGYYGLNCESKCVGHCKDRESCNHTSGVCNNGCDDGWTGPNCIKECPMGTFGPDCAHKCIGNCLDEITCNRTTGKCDNGCNFGYTGELCDTGCENGTFGKGCSNQCSGHCLDNVHCNSISGHCEGGCASGYVGLLCNKADSVSNAFSDNCNETPYIAGLSVMVILSIALGSVCVLFIWKYYRLVKKMQSLQYTSITRAATHDKSANGCQQYEELHISEDRYNNIELRNEN